MVLVRDGTNVPPQNGSGTGSVNQWNGRRGMTIYSHLMPRRCTLTLSQNTCAELIPEKCSRKKKNKNFEKL